MPSPERLPNVASDLMTPEPVCAARSDPVNVLIRLLHEHEISGVPVVDDLGRAIGIVSKTDILRTALDGNGSRAPAFLLELLRESDVEIADFADADLPTAEEIMTPEPACVRPDAPIAELARTMAERRIHRLLVTDRIGIPLGVVTSLDLLAAISARDGRGRR